MMTDFETEILSPRSEATVIKKLSSSIRLPFAIFVFPLSFQTILIISILFAPPSDVGVYTNYNIPGFIFYFQ